jgi:TIR domain
MATRPRRAAKRKPPRRRVRRSYRELFIDKLKELSGGEQKLVSNTAVRDALEWDEERYARIKAQLVDERVILVGRGQGGTVGLADTPGEPALKVFISYSHADEALKDELLKHLSPLKRMNLIEEWHDRKLKAGEEWDRSISRNLESADIILLLVSIDFVNSKYCYDIELDKALELHDQKKATVIPIILRNCLWQHTPFAKLQALPRDAKAVNAWPDRDEALASVAEGIKVVAETLRQTR